MEKTAADVLEEAADAWESGRVDWVRGSVVLDAGLTLSACALGGLALASGVEVAALDLLETNEGMYGAARRLPAEFRRARAALAQKLQPGSDHEEAAEVVVDWNDGEVKTVEEVISVFKETAKDLRNG